MLHKTNDALPLQQCQSVKVDFTNSAIVRYSNYSTPKILFATVLQALSKQKEPPAKAAPRRINYLRWILHPEPLSQVPLRQTENPDELSHMHCEQRTC